jgi:hypothetical protein
MDSLGWLSCASPFRLCWAPMYVLMENHPHLVATKNYGQKRSWSAVGAEQVLERVSEHFQFDLERLKQRSIRNNLAAVRDYALLGSRRIESRRNCGVIWYSQQQFDGSDDSANRDPTRSNSEGLKASNKS